MASTNRARKVIPLAGDYGRPGTRPRGDVDWSRHVHDVDIAGSRVHYIDYGDRAPGGPVFVLSHGLGGRWQHWTENIAELGEHGRVIALDLPGFGRSEPPKRGYSIDTFADTIAELADALRLPRIVLVGHSLGGPIVMRFALRHPERVAAVVLAAGTVQDAAAALAVRARGPNGRPEPRTVAAIAMEVLTAGLPAPAALRRQVVDRPPLRRLLLWPYLHRPGAMPSASIALIVDGIGTRGTLPTARAAARLRSEQWLVPVRCPVLAIGADHDAVAPTRALEEFATRVPDAHTVVLEGCGHMVMLERARAFTAEVADFATQACASS